MDDLIELVARFQHSTGTVIILEFLTHGPVAQQSENPGPYSQGHGTARHPPPKSILAFWDLVEHIPLKLVF